MRNRSREWSAHDTTFIQSVGIRGLLCYIRLAIVAELLLIQNRAETMVGHICDPYTTYAESVCFRSYVQLLP